MRQRGSFFDAFIRYHSRFTFVTWICLAFAISGLACLAIAAGMSRFEWLYHAAAREIQGTVIGKFRARASLGGPSYYGVRYEYHTALGGAFEDEDGVSLSYGDKFRPGDSIKVYYLPEHPGHSRLGLGIQFFGPVIFFSVGALTTLMGGRGVCGGERPAAEESEEAAGCHSEGPAWRIAEIVKTLIGYLRLFGGLVVLIGNIFRVKLQAAAYAPGPFRCHRGGSA